MFSYKIAYLGLENYQKTVDANVEQNNYPEESDAQLLLENLKDLKNHYENIHDIEETSLTTTVENAEQILTKLENKLALKVKNPEFESKMNQISQLQARVA